MKNKRQKNKNSYEIKNMADSDEAEILLYGIVGDYWDEMDAKDIVQDINNLDVNNITVHIYSDGGSVFAGLAIYNALKWHRADIKVVIDSLAASIASVIAMAGKVYMPENSFMMIHNPWGMNIGDADDMEKMAQLLAQLKTSLVGVYKNKTGLKEDKLSDMMDEETWLSAKDALDLGFADEIEGLSDVQDFKQTTVFNQIQKFNNVPDTIKSMVQDIKHKNSAQNLADKSKKKEITMDLKELKKKYPDLAKALMDEGAKGSRDETLKAGAKLERERIQAVAEQSMPGHEDLIADLMYDGETTRDQAAVKVLAAEKKIRINAQKDLVSDTIEPVVHIQPAEPVAKKKNQGTATEDNCKAEYENDPDLQEEFESFDDYFNYRLAEEKGLIKSK